MQINELNCLSVFIDRKIPTMVCSPASKFFNDTVIGYVLKLKEDTTILVTTNPYPYFIPEDIANKYFLSTGDKISATVSADGARRHIVTGIVRVNRQDKVPSNYAAHFDDIPGIPSTGTITVNGQKVSLGSTTMITIKQNDLTNERVADIITRANAPRAEKISLGVQEKPENLTYLVSHGCDYGYNTTALQPLKQQLMITLTAFFRAKELAERGHNVLLFFSSFEKLLFLFNNAILDCFVGAKANTLQNAERDLMRIIKSSKTLPNGGSLTMLGFQIKDGHVDDPNLRHRIATMCDFVI